MTSAQENYIRTNLKWSLTWVIAVKYFLIICIGAASLYVLKNYLDDSTNGTNLIVFLFGLCLSVFALIRIQSERKFRLLKVNSNLTITDLWQKLKPLNWIILHDDPNELEFYDKGSAFSASVYVTIILLNENELLINTRPDKQPFTINIDIANYKKIRLLLNKVDSGNN